jgi:hypothetical protein
VEFFYANITCGSSIFSTNFAFVEDFAGLHGAIINDGEFKGVIIYFLVI